MLRSLGIAALLLFTAFDVTAVETKCQNERGTDLVQARALVCAKDVDGLQQFFDRKQRAYEAGSTDDSALLAGYGAFDARASSDLFEAWLKKYPASYVARVAEAAYQIRLGQNARGTRYAKDTSERQFGLMAEHFERAATVLKESIALTKKPYATYYYMLMMGRYASYGRENRTALDPQPQLRQILAKAIELDSKAYWARYEYMFDLQTRWGGSLPAMLKFYDESTKAGLQERRLATLRSLTLYEQSWLIPIDGDREEKLRLLVEANRLTEDVNYLRDIVWVNSSLQRHADVVPAANRALEFRPGDKWLLMRRGVALWQLGRNPEAYVDFVAAANQGDGFCLNKVGYFLWMGLGVPQDKRAAVQWWVKAAAAGDKDGIINLKMAKTQGLEP